MATVKVKLVKSAIGHHKKQKATLVALKLTKMNRVVEFEDTPQLQGMIKKVQHLVEVVK